MLFNPLTIVNKINFNYFDYKHKKKSKLLIQIFKNYFKYFFHLKDIVTEEKFCIVKVLYYILAKILLGQQFFIFFKCLKIFFKFRKKFLFLKNLVFFRI